MTETGDPKELICEAVEKSNVQLLVLGSHSRGAITRCVLFLDHVLLKQTIFFANEVIWLVRETGFFLVALAITVFKT